MSEIILYPTETVYGLGVNALDEKALKELYELKGRGKDRAISWLVRDVRDIEKYAEVSLVAKKIIDNFLPGPLTLVLPLKKDINEQHKFLPTNIGFRISKDKITQKLVFDYMLKNNAPLTSTSANISNEPTKSSVDEILEQFSEEKNKIIKIVDDGVREGKPSTVVSVVDNEVSLIREGVVSFEKIKVITNTD